MNNKKAIAAIVAGIVLVLVAAQFLYGKLSGLASAEQLAVQSEASAPESEGETAETAQTVSAPDVTFYDRDGNAVQLSDFAGKPVVLNFWASWCGPCKSEMPDFDAAWQELGEDVHFVMVNMTDGSRETVGIASAFVEEQGYSFPVYYDTDQDAAVTYSVYSLPTTYFINAEGELVAQALGAIDAETLQKGLDMILPPAETS